MFIMQMSILSVMCFTWIHSCSAKPQYNNKPTLTWLEQDSKLILHQQDQTDLVIVIYPAEDFPWAEVDCLFTGHVERDEFSSVTVSGCMNDTDTVLMSVSSILVPNRHLDLAIDKEGRVNIVKESMNKAAMIDYSNDDPEPPPEQKEQIRTKRNIRVHDVLEPPPEEFPTSSYFSGNPPTTVTLKTDLWYDNSLLQKFGNSIERTKQWIARVVAFTKTRLSVYSLGIKVKLEVNDIRKVDMTLKANNPTIYDLASKKINPNNLNSYFCYDLLQGTGTVGIAFRGAACRREGHAVNINEYYTDSYSEINTARTYAHELGHNIGIKHDFDDAHGGEGSDCDGKGLMSYNRDAPDAWSSCSKSDFEKWYRSEGHECLENAQTAVSNNLPSCPYTMLGWNCQFGPGMKYANSHPSNWDLTMEMRTSVDDHYNCKPCCVQSGYSIDICV